MARILPDVARGFGPIVPQRQRFMIKKQSDEDKALKIMQAISGGVGTAAQLYKVGTDIYDRAKETPEEALARVQKSAYEQNLATRQSELDRARRESTAIPAAVKARIEAQRRMQEGRQEFEREVDTSLPSEFDTQVPTDTLGVRFQGQRREPITTDVPVIDVVTMRQVSPRLPPSTRALMRSMTKSALQEGRARLPNPQELQRMEIQSSSSPEKQRVLLQAISRIQSQESARPVLEQLDQLMAYEQFTTDDLVMLARQARTPEEAMQIARAADMALDIVPSSALPGARTGRGQDLAATIEARRKVLNAYKQRKPMTMTDMAKVRLDLAKANKAQAEADKINRRGKVTRRSQVPDNKWRQAMKFAGVSMPRKRKLTEADKKGFVNRVRSGAFSELGSPEEAFAKIEAETGLNLRNSFLPEPEGPVKPEASPAVKGAIKRASQYEKTLQKAETNARAAILKLKGLGVEKLKGIKNVPDITATTPESVASFAESVTRDNERGVGQEPVINPTSLNRVLSDLISAVTTAQNARFMLEQAKADAAASANPFASAPERPSLPTVGIAPRKKTAGEMIREVFKELPTAGVGSPAPEVMNK